jgi:CRISPR-associated protein Cas2
MVVLITECATPGVRGELSRWMIEPRAGLFVGKMSATVRDKLWDLVCKRLKTGGAALLYSSPTEQGFVVRTHGERARELVDYEGLTLVRIPKSSRKVGAESESSDKSTLSE